MSLANETVKNVRDTESTYWRFGRQSEKEYFDYIILYNLQNALNLLFFPTCAFQTFINARVLIGLMMIMGDKFHNAKVQYK